MLLVSRPLISTLASYGTQTVSETLFSLEVPVLFGIGPGALGSTGVGVTGVGGLAGEGVMTGAVGHNSNTN